MNVNQHRCLSLSLPPSLSFSSSLSLSPSPSLSLSLTLSPCSLIFNQVGQNFTFVLTDIESKQRFGFCRLSSGAHTCYCILSYLPWFEVFYKLLNILADYRVKGQESQWEELLVSLHTLPIPEPGVPVHLGVHSFFTVPDPTELPSIPENRNLTEYFVAVDVNNMLHLYASMLYERRILICCSKLSTLTACVHGSAAMLFPMHWQHVYIPVLPQHLLDYCCAPMPYLIGVHSSLMEKVRGMALDDVVILNVDTNMLETPHDDLQSLPNDVVSALKSRLKKVSTTTGVGVAQAFLKSQAALFGSYRSALHIESGEPITFSEDAFINHRSSAMRQFLHNAIQLQLFKQFIDGRLDLLNSGEGFNDIFEEEINMGEYAGSDKTYHQWLFTVKKGGGAIFNTVKTKANPAMKTVYKFAKDHARMRIKEVKSRLKQKASTQASARPPLPLKRPISNLSLENSIDQPQPYRSLKEAQLIEGDDLGLGTESHTAPPSPVNEKLSNISLLGDIFGCQDEPDGQPVTSAKSLEDVRTAKDAELQAKFTYQRMDLSSGENSRTLPGLKLSAPYHKLWSSGQDGAAPSPSPSPSPSVHPPTHTQAHSPTHESAGAGLDPLEPSTPGNITIPRPHGRKTPELGSVLAPPVGGRTTSGAQEFRQALSMTAEGDLLRPPQGVDSVDLIRLLDPLNSSADVGVPAPPPRSYQQGLPPFGLHPHMSLNPFSQSLQHRSPTVGGNPFNAVYRAPPGSYLPGPARPQSFPTLPGLYRQPSPDGSGLPRNYGLHQAAYPPPGPAPPPSSASSHALSSLTDASCVVGAKPACAEAADPFGDLLTLAAPASHDKKKVEDLRRKWETFD
uniref:DENN/MADD domain containing 1A n=1 Tax=Salarias fasciatus TaxID=181472 RepID=A0A672J557_SALFA